MSYTLSNFTVIRPPHEVDQEKLLEWVAAAHSNQGASILDQLKKIGLGSGKIARRGVAIADCLHQDWETMEVYKDGSGLGVRTAAFDRIASEVLKQFYPKDSTLPHHLIHVTCTGYTAPSPAQKLVALRGAGSKTTVTHAYHMGCYAAIPAIRMAMTERGTDIVHTEVCSLHMNPSFHTMDQLVVQSLFADGFIKYSVETDPAPGFEVLAIQEEILPDSIDVMTWKVDGWGMKMTLSKEIPALIVRALPHFVETLLNRASVTSDETVYFAIHPGGPKIIEQIAALMKLEPWQFSHSAHILKICGNMSSATLPHIWKAMWDDPSLKNGAKIISLAFGPGLTLAGVVLQCNR